jgi:hypothetical protein
MPIVYEEEEEGNYININNYIKFINFYGEDIKDFMMTVQNSHSTYCVTLDVGCVKTIKNGATPFMNVLNVCMLTNKVGNDEHFHVQQSHL